MIINIKLFIKKHQNTKWQNLIPVLINHDLVTDLTMINIKFKNVVYEISSDVSSQQVDYFKLLNLFYQ